VLYAGTGAPVLLGAGGYGEVRLHRGETGWPGVAVKVLNEKRSALLLEDSAQGTTLLRRAASAAEREAALVTETLALSVVSHRHVVHLFTAAMRGGKLHIFMALAPGGDLASAFDAAPAHTAWRAQGWRLTCEVASGLAYLHAREPPIFHRDVKPANILLSACLPHGHAQLTDFGISSSTRFGAADGVGTEVWAAPEVRGGSGGGTADGAAPPAAICFAKADVFPVGLLVYKFVTQARDQQMLNLRPTLRLIPCPACGEWLARAGDTMRCAEAECVQDDACSADAAELACAAAAKLAGRPDLNELRRLLACCEPALAAAAGEETDTPAAATAAGTSEQDGDTAPCCSDSVSVAFMDD
jgi:serine/threonine protein kinase